MLSLKKTQKRPFLTEKNLDAILRAKGYPCVSLILPLQTKSAARNQNDKLIGHAVEQAIRSLDAARIPEARYRDIVRKLKDLAASIDPNHVTAGIGLFVSATVSERFDFPFPVTECVQIDSSFETRDVYYFIQHNRPYHILSISKQDVRLFVSHAETIDEIRDGYFPRKFQDSYEYAPPSRANSFGGTLKGFEKDKSILSDLRVSAHLKKAADYLSKYLGDHHAEIVLAGSAKLIHGMERHHALASHVIGKVEGTFDTRRRAELARLAWQACTNHRKAAIEQLIKTVGEATLTFRRRGIRAVWEAAAQGKGLLLLVEKDHRQRAYIPEGSDQIRLRIPKGRYRVVEDAVDDVIEMVVQKGGSVLFAPENSLKKFERIVLLLRYP